MFTGIIEEIGTVKSVNKQDCGAVISVSCSKILDDLKIGDSVAVSGACQTVTKLLPDGFDVDTSQETLDVSTLKYFQSGTKVNLERAMSAGGRFGGHFVTGHVDGIGEFVKKIPQGIFVEYYFSAPDEIANYIVYKGSITVDGISLTIATLEKNIFSIAVIPQTIKETCLQYLNVGDKVNLESDILAKYIEKFVSKSDNTTGKLTESYLEEHGFM